MLYVFWVTRDCNLRCDYCYLEKQPNYMSKDIAKKAVEYSIGQLKDNLPDKKIDIVFHGGEPILNFDVVKEIVNKYKSYNTIYKNFRFSMTTNGTIINEDIIKFLKKNDICLSVSVDGREKEHNLHRKFKSGVDTFNIIIANLLRYKEEGIDIRVRMTVTPETVNSIFENYKFFYNMGFRSIPFVLDLYNKKWTKEDMENYYRNFKKIIEFLKNENEEDFNIFMVNLKNNINIPKGICSGGKTSIHFNYNGDLYPCSFSIGEEDYKLGDIFSGINNKKQEWLQEINKKENEQCSGCGFYKVCDSTRCKLLNKSVNGDYYAPCPVNCYKNNAVKRLVKEYEADFLNVK